ncbi:hypothetical protein [Phycicoccus sonneratiae]|uniref:Restriction endonuclease n=1 Tax=Phycicoccus sonneratiae TaxID=2807628 RepID=A0ABS2CR42_9MICO|nr:hypothetical protein [Phycicoccus sonneraticus]MBM6402300.1 hypothetical protein [Phycicoccus sonneraticus]
MPARTNPFQETIALLQQALAEGAEGTRVEESAMLTDRITQTAREVDVCIFTRVAGHEVTVSIECRDWKRPQDVSWVEQEYAKHLRLPTNVLVLVSSSGFTQEALALASSHGVATLVPGPLPKGFAHNLDELINTLWLKTINATPVSASATLEATDDAEKEVVALTEDTEMWSADGSSLGSAREQSCALISHALNEQIDEVLRDATGAETTMNVEAVAGPPHPNDRYIKVVVNGKPVLRRVTRLDVLARTRVEVVPMPMSHAVLGETAYAHGTARTSTHEFQLVTTNLEQRAEHGPGWGATRIKPLKRTSGPSRLQAPEDGEGS